MAFVHRVWDGQKISEPGMYRGIHMFDYHRGDICDGPSVSSSGFKAAAKSLAHFWDTSPLNKNRADDEDDKEVFILGRAVHHLFLGEPHFAKLFCVRPGFQKTGKRWTSASQECRDWEAEQIRARRTILTPAMATAIEGMAKSLHGYPYFRQGVLHGWIERSLFWKDAETGLWLKSRPDVIPNADLDVVDLKTIDDITDAGISHAIGKFGYYQQGALIYEAFQKALGVQVNSFQLLFVEKKRPYCCRLVPLKDDDLVRGHDMNHIMLRRIARGLKTGEWPGPGAQRGDAVAIGMQERHAKFVDAQIARAKQEEKELRQ
jgi:hypothetical protein